MSAYLLAFRRNGKGQRLLNMNVTSHRSVDMYIGRCTLYICATIAYLKRFDQQHFHALHNTAKVIRHNAIYRKRPAPHTTPNSRRPI